MAEFQITLVHGTFAQNAQWTREGSDFRTALSEHLAESGHKVDFPEPLAWNGANRVFARRKAADKLVAKLRKQTEGHSNAVHVAIGHSHGGSAVAYALKTEPHLAHRLAGVVFLATPFIDVRAHPNWRRAAQLLALSFFAAMWLTAFVACLLAIANYYDRDWLVWAVLGVFAFIAVAGWGLETRVTSYFSGFLKQRIERFIDDVSTSNLPDAPAYRLARAPADEAAAFLSFVQFVAWLTAQVFYAFASAAHSATRGLQRIWRAGLPGQLFLVVATALIVLGCVGAIAGFFIAPTDRNLSWFDDISLLDRLFYAATNPGIDFWWLRVLVIAAVLGFTGLAIGAAVVLFATVVSVITHAAFGTAWTAGPFVELAVEPVPRGGWVLHRSDWPEQPGLAHSWPYASPQAVKALATWIASLPAAPSADREPDSSE